MLILLASVIVSSVVGVADVPNPRTANHWVADQANVLDANAEATIEAVAQGLKDRRGIELAVVTVDDVAGTPKAFATGLFNHWGIGDAQTRNGVLVLLVMGQRRLEIETGTGIEAALPPAWLADMQTRDMVPRFKAREFGGGLVAGVQAIAAHIGAAPGESVSEAAPGEYRSDGRVVTPDSPSVVTNTPSPSSGSAAPQPSYAPPGEAGSSPLPFALGGLGLVGAGGAALGFRQRKKNRTCTTCTPPRPMIALDEAADDAHLDEGQRAEERVNSVDYEVLICPGCQASRTLRHGRWFSSYSTCDSCRYKTASSTSVTLVHATYDHGGKVQITERCAHCSHTSTRIRHTARRTPPSTTSSSSTSSFGSSSRSSSSSSSRSSSFGGGSSRGGGAGSSW